MLLDRVEMLNLPRLTHWLVERQMGVEGGFQGRTNKLVDGCYSFWQGGSFPLLEAVLASRYPRPHPHPHLHSHPHSVRLLEAVLALRSAIARADLTRSSLGGAHLLLALTVTITRTLT